MRFYEPPVPFEESRASNARWSDLVPAIYGAVRVCWEDIEPIPDGESIDIIFLLADGRIAIGGWYYEILGDEWEKAEPDDLRMAFEDGFIVTTVDLAIQWAAMIRKLDPDDKTNLALEEVLDYIASKEEVDCE